MDGKIWQLNLKINSHRMFILRGIQIIFIYMYIHKINKIQKIYFPLLISIHAFIWWFAFNSKL